MLKKITNIVDNYLLGGALSGASTSTFWYLRERANLATVDDLRRYRASICPSPFYPMDYRKKLKYSREDANGIIVLNYGKSIGTHINPEASFQFALGLHDTFLHTNNTQFLRKFFYYADFFCRQQERGHWHYRFNYFESLNPWGSALAQSRGISVMARAYLHTRDYRFLKSAITAFETLEAPIVEGGYKTCHKWALVPYYEEYPKQHSAVINGYMASLFGVWEAWSLLGHAPALRAFREGIASLAKMLPHYSLGWWSTYDQPSGTWPPNVNSPRYHYMEIEYLKILSVISSNPQIIACRNQRIRNAHFLSIGLATPIKIIRKILVR